MATPRAPSPVSSNIIDSRSAAPSAPHTRLDPGGDTSLRKPWCHHSLLPGPVLLHSVTPLPSCSPPKLSPSHHSAAHPFAAAPAVLPQHTDHPDPILSGQPSSLTNHTPKGPSCACSAGEKPGLVLLPSAGLSLWQETPLLHTLLLLSGSAANSQRYLCPQVSCQSICKKQQ